MKKISSLSLVYLLHVPAFVRLSMVSKSMGSSEACLDTDRCIESAPVDMYPKCGSVTEAHAVFERITDPDTILWFTILSGYS